MSVAMQAGDDGAAGSTRKRKLEGGEFEWETSKENVMPLKRGRKVPDLNRALRAHESFQDKLRVDEQARRMEQQVASYEGDDPLAAWSEYVRWIETHLPEDMRRKFGALEKCTRALKDVPRYKNDMRYIRMWIQYADLVSNPKDIFKYLYQHKIGESVALFYIGWAWVLESLGRYPEAHKIYLKATQKKAAPDELLARKFKEFQRRMSRHWLRVNEDADSTRSDDPPGRVALENITAFDPSADTSDYRLQLQRQQLANSRAESVRRANAHKPVFIVYEDPADVDADPFDSNTGWRTLDTVQNQNKENDLAPRPWSLGSQPRPEPEGPTARAASGSSAFEVFVDDDCNASSGTAATDIHALTHRSHSLRQRIDGASTEEEQLAAKPLKNFSENPKESSQAKARRRPRPSEEVIAYKVELLKPEGGGDLLSFEEIRAQAYERKRSANATAASSRPSNSFLAEPTAPVPRAATKPVTTGRNSFLVSEVNASDSPAPRKFAGFSVTAGRAVSLGNPVAAAKYAELDAAAQDDVTINTRVAMEDVNSMFCSPQRPQRTWEPPATREEDPVERKLHFSIFDDSVDSVAVNAQDQSTHLENEAAGQFQIFADDEESMPNPSKKPQPRKALQSRDDLVRGVRLTNKDVIMRMQATADESEEGASERPPHGGR